MRFNRRYFAVGALAAPFLVGRAAFASEDTEGPVRNNISAFRVHEWQDHFDALGLGIIISDTTAKVLQHWTGDGQMFLYPSSVPLSEDLTLQGLYRSRRKARQPKLDTDAIDAGAQSRVASICAGRRPQQPAWNACPLFVLAILPHPRHPRYAENRAPFLKRLHRPLQRAY